MAEDKSLMQTLGNLDYRIIYTVMMVLTIWPLVAPMGLPMIVTEPVINYAEVLDELQPGDIVMCSFSGYSTMLPDVEPIYIATWKVLFEKHVKLLIINTHADSPIVIEQHFYDLLDIEGNYGYTYGEDYVFLPVISITEAAEMAFTENMKNLYTTDMYGTNLDDLSMMDEVTSAWDLDLYICEGPEYNTRRYAIPYGVKLICWGTGTGLLPFVPPYYDPVEGPVYGYVGGASMGGELEVHLGSPGQGAKYNDVKNLAIVGLLIFVAIGNIADFVSGSKEAID